MYVKYLRTKRSFWKNTSGYQSFGKMSEDEREIDIESEDEDGNSR